jgi:glyoxylase-like metal-dependent hydrolase (beta-lactamase superfamily II)
MNTQNPQRYFASEVSGLKLCLLSNGYFTLDKSLLVYSKYHGQTYRASLKPLLVITEEEKILIDTGIGKLPEKYRRFHTMERKPDLKLTAQLQKHNLRPNDIDTVINTHLHFDHCGNNDCFKNAKFYVQNEELHYAYSPDRFQKAAYVREFFDVGVDYVPVRGRYDLTDMITLIPTPGHSIGHQSVIIKREEKSFVYCGDAAPLRENLEKRNIPGVLYRSDQALKSIDKLRGIKDATYVYSHDNEQLTL